MTQRHLSGMIDIAARPTLHCYGPARITHPAYGTQVNDAYTVLLREKKLPMSLLEDPEKPAIGSGKKAARMHLLTTQPFEATFGKGRQRKRPRLATDDLSALLARSQDTTLQCVFRAAQDPVKQACQPRRCVLVASVNLGRPSSVAFACCSIACTSVSTGQPLAPSGVRLPL